MYLKFCGVDFDVCNSNEPDGAPSGKLPYLATVTGAVYDQYQIHDWLKRQVWEARDQVVDNLCAYSYFYLH